MAQSNDYEQLTGEVIQVGTVVSVDHAAHSCTVELGELTTGDVPWFAWSAGGVRIWAPPSVGEQGAVLSPEGDLDNGLFLPGLYSDAFPPPSTDADVVHIQMPDGAVIAYNHATHSLTVTLPDGGTAVVDAPGGTTWKGPVTFTDNVTVNATLTASEDVIGGGKSLKSHKHSGVSAGGAQTGAPV